MRTHRERPSEDRSRSGSGVVGIWCKFAHMMRGLLRGKTVGTKRQPAAGAPTGGAREACAGAADCPGRRRRGAPPPASVSATAGARSVAASERLAEGAL